MLKKFGIQAWTVRDHMPKDDAVTTAETFKKLAEFGYTELQTISLNLPAEEYAKLAHDNGISIVGTHLPFDSLTADPEMAMETHRILGTTNIGIGGFYTHSFDELKAFCEKANKFAEIIHKNGFRFTYHNHSHEFRKIDGDRTIMDYLVDNLDPVNTSFCLDTYWVQHGGGDVRSWIEKLAGRIDILHLKEMEVLEVKEDDRTKIVQQYTHIGNGNLEWKKIVETAEKTGVKHYIVEQDSFWVDGDPMKAAKKSADYIKANLM
ncbi:MAG: sugar phosphate isomerase/epimerase [Clostridia bacterium]|nr:sugar phosphate isomerase/epimerase [Clostridia bacterium]